MAKNEKEAATNADTKETVKKTPDVAKSAPAPEKESIGSEAPGPRPETKSNLTEAPKEPNQTPGPTPDLSRKSIMEDELNAGDVDVKSLNEELNTGDLKNFEEKFEEALKQSGEQLQNFADAPQRQLTFGERAVGVSFNPSKDPRVDEMKAWAAWGIDKIKEYERKADSGGKRHFAIATTELESVQMRIVKALTWSDN